MSSVNISGLKRPCFGKASAHGNRNLKNLGRGELPYKVAGWPHDSPLVGTALDQLRERVQSYTVDWSPIASGCLGCFTG